MNQVDKIREYSRRTPVFDTKSIARLVGDPEYAYLALSRLLKSGEIRRLTKGHYTFFSDPSVLVYCLKPAYLGLQDAMSFHNLWEQETNPIILTTRKARPGTRKVLGGNVIIRRISPKHFFGYEYLKQGDLLLPVSDIEKTFIDMAYFRELRKDMTKAFRGRVDREKLREYLKKYDRRFAGKVSRIYLGT
ncbi:MAG TPA: type IV toxin-antitoxin system AbiEi family antitoxin domain-containing protein [archaeon]|nr:type IV toxin-antitoxin system AbiEi family antitoxin domain-containing protein [archaeon]